MNRILICLILFSNTALSQVDLNLGLQAYYPFSGNANDASGNNNNPIFNNASLTFDKIGNPNSAYHFNGTDSYMKVLNSPSLNMTDQMSISLLVRPSGYYTGTCYNNMMVMKGFNDNNSMGNYFIRFSDVYTGCSAPTTTVERFYGTGVVAPLPIVQLNEWYSVVWTYDGTTAKMYVNCELKQSVNINLTFTNPNDLFIGRMEDPSFPYWLNGDLDEVRIYNRALNLEEVKALGSCLTECNNWLNLPSYQSYVSVGDLDIPGNQITVEASFIRTTPYSNGYNWAGDLVSKHVDPVDVNYLLRPNNAEITTSNGYITTPPICEIELNKVYHAAMVYDGSTLKFYRNGFLMSSVAATGNLFQNNHQTRIGLYDALVHNTNLIGYINEVRIWNVVRTQSQLRSFMNTSLPNPSTQAGLQAYYTFENLINKQGNTTWNGILGGSASINSTAPLCNFFIDSCSSRQAIGNIINDYTPVIALNPCENKITVEDGSSFNTGDTVLIIQMKGAIIDSTNTAAFGTITDYRNAGNYEFNYVKSKTGNIVELQNTFINLYDIPDGLVQLIRVPYYQNVNITSTLTCLPWDGKKGGVLVLNVQDTVELNADIDVSSKGFKGGQPLFGTAVHCNKTDYFYPSTNNDGGQKGEGIANLSISKRYGRGSLANGGGGGNSHNAGGAGGGNAGLGGTGGNQYPLALCPTIIPVIGGVSGKSLTYSNTLNKIFLGGGGGSGHANDLTDKPGGNGGGIVILIAKTIVGNSKFIKANGENVIECIAQTTSCANDGHSGGGAGGTILLSNINYTNTLDVEANGGKGADAWILPVSVFTTGPGGGGGGGMTWLSLGANPGINTSVIGGLNGVAKQLSNDPWGATPGSTGSTLFNLSIPITTIPFKPNIDSVRFNESTTACSSFDFEGLGYTITNPISNWQWFFGDGNTANTQNSSHTYTSNGTYIVKLIVTDINGCKDSISKSVIAGNGLDFDFNYKQDVCNPLSVQFNGVGSDIQNPFWSFGDANTISGILNPLHTYTAEGNYIVRYSVNNGSCTDTITKTISIASQYEQIIETNDTTICIGSTKKIRTTPSLGFCWSPTTYLDDPNSPNPTTSTPQNITYYFTAEIPGTNIITNGDFEAGNTGFTSAYNYATPNITEGQYYVGTSPQAWNPSLSSCSDHSSFNGKMMMVNGAPTPDVKVWSQTINVLPNTNYAFSTWIQALWPPNPAQLQFSINNNDVGTVITASLPTCTWTQFYTTWNSGNNTTANISIVNKNTMVIGNDFALDDISFAPVIIKKDSVVITVETPIVTATNNTTICEGNNIQLNATGSSTYSWSPSTNLSDPAIANPLASPSVTTSYIVTGTSLNGCQAKDTVNITVNPKPVITKSLNDTICTTNSTQLFASGGVTYSWSPITSLNNPNIFNPVAMPTATTKYYVTVTDANLCNNIDSILITVRSANTFGIDAVAPICLNNSTTLNAFGGDTYSWQPAASLNNASINNPIASPAATTVYSVLITDTVCNINSTLSATVSILPLPTVKANKSNDLDCSTPQSQLTANGGIQYSWSPAASLSNPTIVNPIATPAITTKYIVTGTDVTGCVNTDSITVNVSGDNRSGYLMPTAFTPNNDGKNDCYRIKYWGLVEELEFSIYNRWGERVFFTRNPNDCWDGRYKGVLQNPAVFVYIIKAKTSCDNNVFRKGTFALIR